MSVYFVKRKGWRFDFTLKGTRHTKGWFQRKQDARTAEIMKREELKNLQAKIKTPETPTDTDFLELINRRLDKVENYSIEGSNSSHYRDVRYHCLRWIKQWNGLACSEITTEKIEDYLKKRKCVSAHVANKELQYLNAMFNYGVKKKMIEKNPAYDIEKFPIDKLKKYVPPNEDIWKVINAADPEAQQYLWTIVLTAGRVSEINKLTWDDVNFKNKLVTLWTRKRKGGNREPREVPMIQNLDDILLYRFQNRDPDMPWVYWHRYWSRKAGDWIKGPYTDRKKLMRTLCRKANVKYFRYHAMRHFTASTLDDIGVKIGVIQRILGHKNRRTTEIYLHPVGNSEREAMSKFENTQLSDFNLSPNQDEPTNVPAGYWSRKVKRPPCDQLIDDIQKLGYTGTGRKYGVSDNAIRKWLKVYDSPLQRNAK